MREALLSTMPKQLRNLFVRILIYCNVVPPLNLWNTFKTELSKDFSTHEGEGRYIRADSDKNNI